MTENTDVKKFTNLIEFFKKDFSDLNWLQHTLTFLQACDNHMKPRLESLASRNTSNDRPLWYLLIITVS